MSATNCPFCESESSEVRDTRKRAGFIWRRRMCANCEEVFSTVEVTVSIATETIQDALRNALEGIES